MKINDGHHHLCVECLRIMDGSCEWFSHKKEIEGCIFKVRHKGKVSERRKITECPNFVADTECMSCTFAERCTAVVAIGQECRFHERRLKDEQNTKT